MKKLLSVFLCFGLSCPAMGITGNEWLSDVEEPDGTPEYLGAMAYLAGIYQQHSLSGTMLECITYPEGVNVTQTSRILQKYMDDNPDITHVSLVVIFHLAMRDAFGTKPLSEDGFCD